MTEVEWLACENPWPMLGFLQEQANNRKVRLFAVYCCHGVRGLLESRSLSALDIAERYADGLCNETELTAAASAALDALNDALHTQDRQGAAMVVSWACNKKIRLQCPSIASQSAVVMAMQQPRQMMEATNRLATLDRTRALRDIVGNPFRPLTLSAANRTPTVASLARAVYDERQLPSGELDTHRLAVLADALEEAGETGELLEHLRSPGPHVRGCHVVDLCLGLS
jgi:hypothetical protein